MAVKLMKKDVIGNDAFAQEALRVHNLNHPNVIRLLATCLTTAPSMLIFEFMHVGDLKSFLRNSVNGTGLNHVLRMCCLWSVSFQTLDYRI